MHAFSVFALCIGRAVLELKRRQDERRTPVPKFEYAHISDSINSRWKLSVVSMGNIRSRSMDERIDYSDIGSEHQYRVS